MINIIQKCAATIMVAALCACGSGSGSSSPADTLLTPSTFVDSISVSFGDQWGARQAQAFVQLDEKERSELDVDEFIAGLRNVLMADRQTPGMIKGISKGIDIAKDIDNYSSIGIYINRGKVMNAIEKILTSDTLSLQTVADYQARFDDRIGSAQNKYLEKMREARREVLLAEKKSLRENEAIAKNYIEKLTAENADVKKSDSGLLYRIASPGQGKPVKMGSTLGVVYDIKGLDGRVIYSSRGMEEAIPFDADLIPGLQEGFAMLSPGAEATFYIPSNLGFGRDNKSVAPGEMIIVTVKINDVK